MTTNIDNLITRLKSADATSAYTSSEAAEALRSQQKRIEELEKVNIELSAALVVELERVHAIRQVVESKTAHDKMKVLSVLHILNTVKGAPAQVTVDVGRPNGDMTVEATWKNGQVVSIKHIEPAQQPYNKRKIAEELIATAQGDSYYGNALYVALDLAEDKDKEILHRYLHGAELTTDRIALQDFANRLAQQPEQGDKNG